MNFTVSDKVRGKTMRCEHYFSCLTNGTCQSPSGCRVTREFDKEMLFVQPEHSGAVESCPYHMTISGGKEHLCTCPTLYSVYQKITRRASYK